MMFIALGLTVSHATKMATLSSTYKTECLKVQLHGVTL